MNLSRRSFLGGLLALAAATPLVKKLVPQRTTAWWSKLGDEPWAFHSETSPFPTQVFEGRVSSLAIYDKALSADQILAMANGASPMDIEPHHLTHYYVGWAGPPTPLAS
jgi:hypothetical protein